MAGVERAGGACATGGGADALIVQQQQKALALDALKAHVYRAGNMMLKAAVYLAVGDLRQLREELVAHGDDFGVVDLHIVA